MPKHPMQPLMRDHKGVIRFKANKILERLFDTGVIDLNRTRGWADCPVEDHEQLAQLLGYSVSSFGNLSYAQRKTIRKADRRASKM